MNDDDIYDEFNYEPEDLEDNNDYTESRDEINLNQRDRKMTHVETPHKEEYVDFDNLNEPEANYNDEENNNGDNELNSGSCNINCDNADELSNNNEKNFEMDNGNIDNYLEELIKNNNMEERNEKKMNKNNSAVLNHSLDSSLKNTKETAKIKSNEITEKIISSKFQPIAIQLTDETNNIQKSKPINTKVNNLTNVLSKMQMAEKEYKELKEKLDKLSDHPHDFPDANQQSVELLAKENLKLIKYLEKISEILDVVVDSSKIPAKSKTRSNLNAKYVKIGDSKSKYATNNHYSIAAGNNINNNKLVEVYKKEYEKLQKRFKQVSDPAYSERLEQTILELNTQLNYYEQENRNLKNRQKQSEFQFERQYKNNNNSSTNFDEEIKKINQEYENMKRLNEATFEKAQKNINLIKESEEKIKTLSEHNQKLQLIAKEMYNIEDFEIFLEKEKNDQKINERRQGLKKKIDILEKVFENNKKKYEAEITRNDKTIMNLEKNKLELMKILKEKSSIAFKTAGYVKGMYGKNEIIDNMNSPLFENEIKTQEMLDKFLKKRDNQNENEINKNISNHHEAINYLNGKCINNNNNSMLINTIDNITNINISQMKNLNLDKTSNNIDVSQFNNLSNINRSIEDTKKEILRELDKNSIDKNISSLNNIDLNKQQFENKSHIEPVEDNKYIGKNNKPNFKFNFSHQQGHNRIPTINTKDDNNKHYNINNNSPFNPQGTEEKLYSKENNQSKENNARNIQGQDNLNKENITTQEKKNPKQIIENLNKSQVEVSNDNKDPVFNTYSRRINNLNQVKPNEIKRDISNINNSNIYKNTEFVTEKQLDVPSFLKDFKPKDINIDNTIVNLNNNDNIENNSVLSAINNKKPSDKMVNLSQNNDISSIMNDMPRRRKDNLGTVKNERKSVFEEALQEGFYENNIENVKKEDPAFLKLDLPQDDYYKKRKEEFDSLFKDEEPSLNKKEEIKSNTNNLFFAKNKESDLSVNSKNVDDSIKKEKKSKAYANILDELEEIDLL